VGSGFGGSVAALRLTEKDYRVGVLEMGRRWRPEDFPRTTWEIRRYLWAPRFGLRGIQRLTLLRHALVLTGVGVGGGSLVYANVLYDADPQLRPWSDVVKRMLGASRAPFETPADLVVRQVAERMGVAETYRPTEVAVDFDTCVRCGGCMVGCRYGAKNTLDRTYLRLAEEGGAVVHAGHLATGLRARGGGWEVATRRGVFRAGQVVLAAGVLGTVKLLFGLPRPPARTGALVRTNSETLVGASARSRDVDYSEGIAIGSSFEPEAGTVVEPVRYPRGSNLMALLSKPLTVRGWSERTILLLCMQTADSTLRLVPRRGGLRSVRAGGEAPPSRISPLSEAAEIAAELIGGRAGRFRLDLPVTAHILGGAVIGDSPATGVVDPYHRVFGHPGLHVVDGSTIGRNLGANPALTIAAQAERAMSFWPRRGEPDERPPS
jgi:cholesterol oxidase